MYCLCKFHFNNPAHRGGKKGGRDRGRESDQRVREVGRQRNNEREGGSKGVGREEVLKYTEMEPVHPDDHHSSEMHKEE